MRKIMCILLLSLWQASPAYSLIKVQVFGGSSSGDFKPDTGSSAKLGASDFGTTLLLDPIPLVPVGFGVSVIQQKFSASIADHGVKDMEGLVVAPEIQAWLPFLPIPLIPYGRLGYAVGLYKATGESTIQGQTFNPDYGVGVSGLQIGVGAKYEPLPLPLLTLAILLEVNIRAYEFDDKTTDILGLPAGESKDNYKSSLHKGSWNGTAILLGVEAGF